MCVTHKEQVLLASLVPLLYQDYYFFLMESLLCLLLLSTFENTQRS